jgi:hypothetical protein
MTEVPFPLDGESFADFVQRQAPQGWTIIAVNPGIAYRITTDDGLTATVRRPERLPGWHISDGWQIEIRDAGISTEFTVTAPDGQELFFHDCFNP